MKFEKPIAEKKKRMHDFVRIKSIKSENSESYWQKNVCKTEVIRNN